MRRWHSKTPTAKRVCNIARKAQPSSAVGKRPGSRPFLQVSQGGVIIGTEMNDGRGIVASPSLLEYFRDVLAGAMERQRIQVAEATEFYLVNLLAEFCRADALFAPDEGGGSRDAEPLAFMLKRAQEATGFERVRELKRLGDTSLYVSGFF